MQPRTRGAGAAMCCEAKVSGERQHIEQHEPQGDVQENSLHAVALPGFRR